MQLALNEGSIISVTRGCGVERLRVDPTREVDMTHDQVIVRATAAPDEDVDQ